MKTNVQENLRKLPAVHRILSHAKLIEWMEQNCWSKEQVTDEVGRLLDQVRGQIRLGNSPFDDEEQLLDWIITQLSNKQKPHLVRVINGTGVILHTNLGRARISESAIDRMVDVARHYSNLEYNIEEAKRGSRHDHVEEIISRITGAEAAMVVNNNAAAVFLILRELAKDREVVISRGQLVEIGGSFRISEIMSESGARLVEVGTTNKTKLSDYERAITPETALFLKVHTSNFRVVGFTQSVETKDLVELGKRYEIPVYEDLGSGVLYDLREHGIGDEPTVQEVLRQGVDLVSFSGDKLLGGPQAGIIAGRKKWIDRLKKNQLARVLRVDKVTLAALEETLRLYLNPQEAVKEIPVLRDLTASLDAIRSRAEQLEIFLIRNQLLPDWKITLEEDVSEVGGGTLPLVTIPTVVLSFSHPHKPAQWLEKQLRLSTPSVISRVSKERVLIDFRTILDDEIEILQEVFTQIDQQEKGNY